LAPDVTLGSGSILAGRYEILEPLGKGGMGVVYKARDRVLDEDVAIKVLRPDVAASPEISRRFLAEIKLARAVSHKNVCRIHEYGEDRGLQYISMAFVDGVDLKRILRERGSLPADEAYDVALQVAEGLQAIHDEGIVHRDLKTPNLMMDSRRVVRLMDFGIAKQWEADTAAALTQLGQIVGTPEYMSPEQVRGEKLDARSDIYALGIVLYELFTGQTPFRSETPIAMLMKHLHEAPAFEGAAAEKIPVALVPVLRKALAKSREERFSSVRELGEALRQARAESHALSSRTPAPIRTATAKQLDTLPLPTPVPTPLPTPVPTAVPTWVPTQPPAGSAGALADGTQASRRGAEKPSTESTLRPTATPSPPRAPRLAVYVAVTGTVVLVGATSVHLYLTRAPAHPAAAPSVNATNAPLSGSAVAPAQPPISIPRPPEPSEGAGGARTASPAAQAPRGQEPSVRGRTSPGGQSVRHTLADQIQGILAEAESAFAAQQYQAAMGFYEEALKLDPNNQRARIGRDLCGQAVAQTQAAGARGGTGKSFIIGQTTVPATKPGLAGPAGFEDSPAVVTRRVTQDAALPGKIYFEVEPTTVKPADAFTVKVFLVNEGQVPVHIRGMTVTTTVNTRRASGPVPPLTSDAPPHQRTLLLSLADSWKADTTNWSMQVEIQTSPGGVLRSELTWK
jgi:serine/threonine protein kinase